MSWKYFSDAEMTCHCGCGELAMDEGFMRWLVELRETFGEPLPITSGFRCWKHEQQLYSIPEDRLELAKTSPGHYHTRGLAADISLWHIETDRIHRLLEHVFGVAFGFAGVGMVIHGPRVNRILHLDTGADVGVRPAVWTYP
jgi:zinc D-Ala-D-Ala carboxypeptidase